jgi:hypothetical protein
MPNNQAGPRLLHPICLSAKVGVSHVLPASHICSKTGSSRLKRRVMPATKQNSLKQIRSRQATQPSAEQPAAHQETKPLSTAQEQPRCQLAVASQHGTVGRTRSSCRRFARLEEIGCETSNQPFAPPGSFSSRLARRLYSLITCKRQISTSKTKRTKARANAAMPPSNERVSQAILEEAKNAGRLYNCYPGL